MQNPKVVKLYRIQGGVTNSLNLLRGLENAKSTGSPTIEVLSGHETAKNSGSPTIEVLSGHETAKNSGSPTIEVLSGHENAKDSGSPDIEDPIGMIQSSFLKDMKELEMEGDAVLVNSTSKLFTDSRQVKKSKRKWPMRIMYLENMCHPNSKQMKLLAQKKPGFYVEHRWNLLLSITETDLHEMVIKNSPVDLNSGFVFGHLPPRSNRVVPITDLNILKMYRRLYVVPNTPRMTTSQLGKQKPHQDSEDEFQTKKPRQPQRNSSMPRMTTSQLGKQKPHQDTEDEFQTKKPRPPQRISSTPRMTTSQLGKQKPHQDTEDEFQTKKPRQPQRNSSMPLDKLSKSPDFVELGTPSVKGRRSAFSAAPLDKPSKSPDFVELGTPSVKGRRSALSAAATKTALPIPVGQDYQTCYLASVLNVLQQIPTFSNLMQCVRQSGQMDVVVGGVFELLLQFLDSMTQDIEKQQVALAKFLSYVTGFEVGCPQDAPEFLYHLLNSMEKDAKECCGIVQEAAELLLSDFSVTMSESVIFVLHQPREFALIPELKRQGCDLVSEGILIIHLAYKSLGDQPTTRICQTGEIGCFEINLIGAVCLNNAHYISLVKGNTNNWWIFNGRSINRTSATMASMRIQNDGYLLFYRVHRVDRVDNDDESLPDLADQNQEKQEKAMKKDLDGLSKDDKELAKTLLVSVIPSGSSSVTWDDISGLEDIKQSFIERLVWPMKYPDIFKNVPFSKGTLLHGQPGTGKTLLARAVASQTGMAFLHAPSSIICSKYVGEAARNIRLLFKIANNRAPCIIFFDEIDTLCQGREEKGGHSSDKRLIGELLNQMDGFNSNKYVHVVAATNLPGKLDKALLRRFDEKLHVPLPDDISRHTLFQRKLINIDSTFKGMAERLVEESAGLSAAAITDLIRCILTIKARETVLGKETSAEQIVELAIAKHKTMF